MYVTISYDNKGRASPNSRDATLLFPLFLLTLPTLPLPSPFHTKYAHINTNQSEHIEIGPVRQYPIQRTVRTAHPTVLIMTLHNFSTQYNAEH